MPIVVQSPPAVPAPLAASVSVKVTDAEKAKIKRDSAAAGLSMSAWSRRRLTA